MVRGSMVLFILPLTILVRKKNSLFVTAMLTGL
jgi:hypothetical protein